MPILKRAFDWESLSIQMDGQVLANVKSVDWSDTHGVSPVFGVGGAPIGWGRRNYRGQGSMEIADEEYSKFMQRCSLQGGIYHASFNIHLAYGDNAFAKGYPDIHNVGLLDCMVSRRGGASRQGAAEARIIRLEFEILRGITEFDLDVLGKL